MVEHVIISEKQVAIEERVVVFTLEDNLQSVTVCEMCDDYFNEALNKKDMRKLIDGLEALYRQMKEDK